MFRFPETLDYEHLVQLQRPDAELPEAMIGPDEHLRRRDGFALTDRRCDAARGAERDRLLPLCHERDKDSLLQGPRGDKTGEAIKKNPLGIPLAGCPLDEKISRDAHCCASDGDAIGALAHRHASTTRCARAPATASATTA